MWVWALVIVAVIGAIGILAAGSDNAMVEAYDDRPDATLPTGRPLTAADLDAVRFSTAVRGYRMDEVDALVARVQADLLARQAGADQVAVEDSASGLDRLEPQDDPDRGDGPPGAAPVTKSP
jgi:DivIVA domain-containing protein